MLRRPASSALSPATAAGAATFLLGYWQGAENERLFFYDAPLATAITAGHATTATNVTNALGQNQTLQNLTASRALGTTYTNSTGVAIYIWVQGTSNTYANYGTQIYLNGVMVSGTTMYTANTGYGSTTQTLVPAGFTYRITGNINLTTWYECR